MAYRNMNQKGLGVLHFKDWSNSYIPQILQEIYIQRIYHPFLVGKKDLVLLDIGLNIGLWSMYASSFAKQVYSFEPSKETFQIAIQNLTDNKITNVKPFQQAIAKSDGPLDFYHNENTTMNSLHPWVGTTGEKETVEGIRLDTFIAQEKLEHIDFIKLDVEGSEGETIMSEGFLKIAPIVDNLVYEFHDWSSVNPYLINNCLKDLGFQHIKRLNTDATVFGCSK